MGAFDQVTDAQRRVASLGNRRGSRAEQPRALIRPDHLRRDPVAAAWETLAIADAIDEDCAIEVHRAVSRNRSGHSAQTAREGLGIGPPGRQMSASSMEPRRTGKERGDSWLACQLRVCVCCASRTHKGEQIWTAKSSYARVERAKCA